MSRQIKKLHRFTSSLFFILLAVIVSSVLHFLPMKRDRIGSAIPSLVPTAHADVPPSGGGGGGDCSANSTACAGGSCGTACSSGPACDCSCDSAGGD